MISLGSGSFLVGRFLGLFFKRAIILSRYFCCFIWGRKKRRDFGNSFAFARNLKTTSFLKLDIYFALPNFLKKVYLSHPCMKIAWNTPFIMTFSPCPLLGSSSLSPYRIFFAFLFSHNLLPFNGFAFKQNINRGLNLPEDLPFHPRSICGFVFVMVRSGWHCPVLTQPLDPDKGTTFRSSFRVLKYSYWTYRQSAGAFLQPCLH